MYTFYSRTLFLRLNSELRHFILMLAEVNKCALFVRRSLVFSLAVAANNNCKKAGKVPFFRGSEEVGRTDIRIDLNVLLITFSQSMRNRSLELMDINTCGFSSP